MNPLQLRRKPLLRVNAQTGTTYLLSHRDHGTVLTFDNAATITVTVPVGLEVGFWCELVGLGAGRVHLSAATGVTVLGFNYAYRLSGPTATGFLRSIAANVFNLTGNVQGISFPTEIAGCVFWLDAADGNSVTQAAGVISQVADKSGNAFHVTATGTAQPTYRYGDFNGKNCIRFDGATDFLQNTSATLLRSLTGWTSFVVSRANSATPAAQKYLWSLTNATNTKAGGNIAGTTGLRGVFVRRVAADGGASLAGTQVGIAAELSGIVMDHSTTTATIYVNGAQVATSAAVGTSGTSDAVGGDIYIGSGVAGASAWWDGDICEVILFNTALSALNRQRVEGYLAAKWGL